MLEKIIDHTQKRVAELKRKFNTGYFEESPLFHSPTVSLRDYLLREDKNGIIAEFKRCSPSKGDLNVYASVQETTIGYMRAGCSGLSVLTEPDFFKGANSFLSEARLHNFCPILRKDFIIDPIQVYEARAIGADAVLLLARVLDSVQLLELTNCALSLGLEIVLEVDDELMMEKILPEHTIVGINSRNLGDMSVDSSRFNRFKPYVPEGKIVIAESGIKLVNQILDLKKIGYNGFLIGSLFMQASNPARACMDFCKELDLVLTREKKMYEA